MLMLPSKPSKYVIKVFWACNAYPFQGQRYTRKPVEGRRHVNFGEKTAWDLITTYKDSGRYMTTKNFFNALELAPGSKQ